ncbi:MAG TPA: acyltransferase family protein, partial [Pirellulaceae bacterium]
FALGIGLYHTLNYAPARRGVAAIGFLAVAGYGCLDRSFAPNAFERHLSEYLVIGGVFAAALVGLRRWDTTWASSRVLAPLRWLGQRSYSIYLTHYLLVVVLASGLAQWGWRTDLSVAAGTVPLCLLITLPIAVLFYEGVERRWTPSGLVEPDLREHGGSSLTRDPYRSTIRRITNRFALWSWRKWNRARGA